MSQQNQVRRIVNVALFGALSVVCARFCQIPFGIGYLNIGDLIIILAAMLVGPIDGALAGMIGGGFADLAAGFGSFIPFTIVAKALLAITVGIPSKAWRIRNTPQSPFSPALMSRPTSTSSPIICITMTHSEATTSSAPLAPLSWTSSKASSAVWRPYLYIGS